MRAVSGGFSADVIRAGSGGFNVDEIRVVSGGFGHRTSSKRY